jgi:hypothetical protein
MRRLAAKRASPLSLVVFLGFTLLNGCQGHALIPRNYSEEAVQWGQTVNGLQVGLSQRTYKEGTEPGRHQLYFTVTMRNVTGRSLAILAPTKVGGTIPEKLAGDESVAVTLTYDGAAGAKPAQFKPIDKPVVQHMEPGKEYPLELRLSPTKFGLERFVAGRITAAYYNAQSSIRYASMGGEPTTGLWTGEARSGAVAIDAPAATTQQQGGENAR